MKKLTHSQLIARLSTSGVKLVGLVTVTDTKARKTDNPFGSIFKVCRLVGMVGANYEAAVQREGAERQGAEKAIEFKADSRKWGTWVIPSKVATHEGNYYLRTISTPGQRKLKTTKVLSYRDAQGNVLNREEVKQFLPAPSKSTKQLDTGMVATVDVREFKFTGIHRIRIDGETFELVP